MDCRVGSLGRTGQRVFGGMRGVLGVLPDLACVHHQCDDGGAMAHLFRDPVRGLSRGQHQARKGMPQIVQAGGRETGALHSWFEDVAVKRLRLDRLAPVQLALARCTGVLRPVRVPADAPVGEQGRRELTERSWVRLTDRACRPVPLRGQRGAEARGAARGAANPDGTNYYAVLWTQ